MRILLLCIVWTVAAPLPGQDRFVQWMDRIAQKQLDAREAAVAKIRTVEEAEARKTAVRARLLELLGGLPDYNGPLNAKVTGRLEKPRYTIEKVIFESLPQLYVTANLYLPRDGGKHPGILFPLGHWDNGKPAVQRTAANLALKGFAVLVYDPLGQGERQQAYDRRIGGSLAGGSVEQHLMAGGQSVLAGESFARYRIWDAKRALDYLVSRPEVDGGKIGCTGCSGGGTVATYISALDSRIKVAAPACYMNTFRLLFAGPTGDSEQTWPGFLSSGLDLADYAELFAPKPWLISSTVGDFFPIEGARHFFHEARNWYGIYGAREKIKWAIGPGGHGTPVEVREAIYEWMIRWLKNGKGDPKEADWKEEPVDFEPDFRLFAEAGGQVGGRGIFQVIKEVFDKRRVAGTKEEMLAELRRIAPSPDQRPPVTKVISETAGVEVRTQQIAFETEPGLEIEGTLYIPVARGRKPAMLLLDVKAGTAAKLAADGHVTLALTPRGSKEPVNPVFRFSGDWLTNTRAWLIGRNLPGMRAADVMRGVDLLVARGDVNAASVRVGARGVAGVWALIAGALDPRISKVSLDRTPNSWRSALDQPLHRDLHAALIPGFALRWDLEDIIRAISPRPVAWTDPTNWMGTVQGGIAGFHYRTFEDLDESWFLER
ncbi:MAG: hypothetical protein EXQ52_02005 [Bryobacterales bacterium]|nr:hypothetical protein [Bryobacterales bacterium]